MKQGLLTIMVVCGSALAAPKPGMPFTNTLGMKFVPIPGAEVQFCIRETRVKDYAAFAATNSGVGSIRKNPFQSFKQEDTHPVSKVNWHDARAFCAWLTKKELAMGKLKAGMRYRLSTDAEWSTAVGLGKEKGNTPDEKQRDIKDVYPWGKGYPPPKEAGNYYKSLKVDNFDYTSPVGSFAANKFGLYDMGGNVFEWCEDKMTSGRELRVLRGASWASEINSSQLLSSYRLGLYPGGRTRPHYGYGFRCVLADGSDR